MGLLTDPSSGQGNLTKLLLKYYGKLCVLLYFSGVIWFAALASPSINANTYFSENALLPGLVKSLFKEDRLALGYYEELLDETQKYGNSIPYSWLLAKFQQIGIDSFTHNFTLNSPLSSKDKYYGKNVYGILRAPRASSVEALVLSVPYRPPSSIFPTTLPSVAMLLAFAKYAVKEKYWAKDIIFLITDHEQLGMQAWLEAYHGVTCGYEKTLDHGDLKGRAGAIQAAINLELHSTRIGHIDIKIEGLNGQLPNLDLFNLAGKICSKEGVSFTFKGKKSVYHRDPYNEWWTHFKNMLSMVYTQATGIPNGNHGLYFRFGIQALTLEGFEESKGGSRVGFLSVGRVIEGIFRSMNNLLERFHQSFFFYILPSSDRYISIGLYMPAVCLIAAALIIKACAMWCKLNEESSKPPIKGTTREERFDIILVTVIFLTMHFCGVTILIVPEIVVPVAEYYGYQVSSTLFAALTGVLAVCTVLPYLLKAFKNCAASVHLLCVFALLQLGTTIICVSMQNFSLGLFCGVISVPFALLIDPTSNKYYKALQKLLCIFVHPLMVLSTVVLVNTLVLFSHENIKEILYRAFDATQQAVVYGIVDSMIYGNWLYTIVTMVLVPNWMCFWCVACIGCQKTTSNEDKKNN